MVPAQEPQVAAQLPTGGDVSLLKPMRSSVLFGQRRVTAVYSRKRSMAASKGGHAGAERRLSAASADRYGPIHGAACSLTRLVSMREILCFLCG